VPTDGAPKTTPSPAPEPASSEPILAPEDEITAEYPEPPLSAFSLDEEPTIERVVPAAVLASRRDDEFRTVNVTFSEILQRVGPRHLGGPLPPIRDDLYTTTSSGENGPASTTDLDSEWNEDTQKG